MQLKLRRMGNNLVDQRQNTWTIDSFGPKIESKLKELRFDIVLPKKC